MEVKAVECVEREQRASEMEKYSMAKNRGVESRDYVSYK